MAKILADRDIRKLIGKVLIDADEKRINPNGIELRLGKHVHFHSTGEEKELRCGEGQSYTIHSIPLSRSSLCSRSKRVYGSDFPDDTFRVLKEKEEKQYSEYHTCCLVWRHGIDYLKNGRFKIVCYVPLLCKFFSQETHF
jgi:hypothetical protein